MNEPLPFFVFGLPKSGTTWLQMLLDAHPDVSCPSEHQVSFALDALPKLVNEYNYVLREVDRRTVRQGETPLGQADLLAVTRAFVAACIASGARRKPVRAAGIKDNTVATHFALFREMFPSARYLCIVRDPRDTAISSWHHNRRVEPDFAARAVDFADWARQSFERWRETYRTVLSASGGADEGGGILILRYEDLAGGDATVALRRVFTHLGIALDAGTAAALFERTGAERLRAGPAAAFVRSARTEQWRQAPERPQFPPPDAATLATMQRFGYPAM